MKMVPETVYKLVNDDGTDVRPATAQKIKDIIQIMKDAKVLGDSSTVDTTVGMRIASAILSNYELRRKLKNNLPVVPELIVHLEEIPSQDLEEV